jgi:hypothetical protein
MGVQLGPLGTAATDARYGRRNVSKRTVNFSLRNITKRSHLGRDNRCRNETKKGVWENVLEDLN